MGYIKKLKNNELVGGTDKTTIYPVTSTKAVFEEVTDGDKSSFQSQESINTDRLERIETLEAHDENHEGRVSTLEEHDSDHESRVQELESVVPDTIRSISINGGTEHTVDETGNVDLTIYTVNPDDPDVPAMVDLVEKNRDDIADIKEEIGTDTTQNTLSGRITELETLVGGNEQGSVNQRIEDAVNALYVPTATVIDDTGHVSITLGETNGKIDSLAVSTNDIASAEALDTLDVYVHAIEGGNIRVKSSTPTNPDTGAPTNTVYRVAGTTTYSDYMWNGTTMVKMAEYNVDTLESQFGYYKWETASNTISITTNNQVTGSPIGSYNLTTGGSFKIKMSNKATGACTLNMNNKGAKTLLYNGVAVSADNTWEAGEVIEVYYDGTQYQCSNSNSTTVDIDDTFLVEGAAAESSAVGELFIKEFNIISIDSFSGWKQNNVVSMLAEHTYHIRFRTSATTKTQRVVRGYDAENTQVSIVSVNVIGDYEIDYSPTVDIVRVDFYVVGTCSVSITETNTSKMLLREDDVVNNLDEGGVNAPLSAEQGKIINNSVRILTTYKAKLSNGGFNSGGFYALSTDCKSAMAVIGNNNISYISIASGYEYQLWGKNDASYTSSTELTLIRGWSSDIWANNSSFGFIWILVRRVDLDAISDSELSNIITISSQTSQYTVANEVDVENAFLIGERRKAKMIKVSGEGLSYNNGSVTVSEAYTRSDYYNVTGISALIFGGNPGTYDSNQFNGKQLICWYDANYSYLGFTNYYWTRETMELIVAVPSNAVFARIHGFSERITEVVKGNTLVSDYIRNSKSASAIGNMKKVTFILCQGQSLFVGADAAGQTTDFSYYPLRMFNGNSPLKKSTNDDDYKSFQYLRTTSLGYETPMIGLGEMFVEAIQRENNISVYSNEWKDHLIVIGGPISGGITIEDLSSDAQFAYMEAMIRNLKKLCDEFGYTFDAPAWCWMQGEQNVKSQMTTGDYKAALLAYHDRVCEAFSNIAGITNRPKCIIYQPACQCLYTQDYGYSNPYLQVLQSFVELLRDNDEFIASTPAYIFTPSSSGGSWVHLNAESYKVLGAYNGYALKRYIIEGVSNKGVIPTNITVRGNTITIKYNVPSPPLVIDKDLVREVDNLGFDVVTSSDSHIITSVDVHYDTVIIVCSESPVGAKLRYGLNGDRVTGIPSNPYTGQDGHEHGGRGNIRDSQGNFIYKDTFGKKIPMYNWAYCFEQIID